MLSSSLELQSYLLIIIAWWPALLDEILLARGKFPLSLSKNVLFLISEFDTVIDTSIKDYSGLEGDFFTLTCNPRKSYPPPRYSWVVTKTTTSTDFVSVAEDNRVSIDHQGM